MDDIEFVVVVGGGGGWWLWWSKVIFVSHPTFVLSWGCDNIENLGDWNFPIVIKSVDICISFWTDISVVQNSEAER